jgi:hypothetical protein
MRIPWHAKSISCLGLLLLLVDCLHWSEESASMRSILCIENHCCEGEDTSTSPECMEIAEQDVSAMQLHKCILK